MTQIMRIDLCGISQLLQFLTIKRDIPADPFIEPHLQLIDGEFIISLTLTDVEGHQFFFAHLCLSLCTFKKTSQLKMNNQMPLQCPEKVFINSILSCLADLIGYPGWLRSPGQQLIYSLQYLGFHVRDTLLPLVCQQILQKHDSCDSYLCVVLAETGSQLGYSVRNRKGGSSLDHIVSGLGRFDHSNGHYVGMFPVSCKGEGQRLYGAFMAVTECSHEKDLGNLFNTLLPVKYFSVIHCF